MILPVLQAQSHLEVIHEIIERDIELEPTQMLECLSQLASLHGLCALVNASILYHYQIQMAIYLPEAKKQGYAPSLIKAYCESMMPELVFKLKLVERLGAALTHKQDNLISQLSYLKAEMNNRL